VATSDRPQNKQNSVDENKETVGVPQGAVPTVAATNAEISRESPAKRLEGPDQSALLDLHLNGLRKLETLVTLRGDDVLVRPADLQAAGLAAHAGKLLEDSGETLVSLKSLAPKVAFEVDESALALRLTVEPAALFHTSTSIASGPQI
jgi:outer membrane usher protein FimD/PapC